MAVTADFRKKLAIIVGAAAVVWFALLLVAGDSGALAMLRARGQHDVLQDKVKVLEGENQRLREEIDRLKNDPRAIEQLAREELMMGRPDEEVILVPDPEPPPVPHPQ